MTKILSIVEHEWQRQRLDFLSPRYKMLQCDFREATTSEIGSTDLLLSTMSSYQDGLLTFAIISLNVFFFKLSKSFFVLVTVK